MTTPIPISDASVSRMKGSEKSDSASTGADTFYP
jgi:hypothetical protein